MFEDVETERSYPASICWVFTFDSALVRAQPNTLRFPAHSKAAEKLIIRRGFDDASMEEIADAGYYSHGAFYFNFAGKDECFWPWPQAQARFGERLGRYFSPDIRQRGTGGCCVGAVRESCFKLAKNAHVGWILRRRNVATLAQVLNGQQTGKCFCVVEIRIPFRTDCERMQLGTLPSELFRQERSTLLRSGPLFQFAFFRELVDNSAQGRVIPPKPAAPCFRQPHRTSA